MNTTTKVKTVALRIISPPLDPSSRSIPSSSCYRRLLAKGLESALKLLIEDVGIDHRGR